LTYLAIQEETFDTKLAKECAKSFAAATGLGAMVSLANGDIVAEFGSGCASCSICELAGKPKSLCLQSHIYGMKEAERFGGKYIYFCPMGLACFVSPIVGKEASEAKVTVGPFLMVELPDYVNYELTSQFKFNPGQIKAISKHLKLLPYVSPEKVNDLSTLLFMSIGFMNNVWAANNMIDTQMSLDIQNHIPFYIAKLKGEEDPPPYPLETEEKLLEAISQSDRESAARYLNELYGYIFFSTANTFALAKSRIYELLVLISRTAIKSGADPEITLHLTQNYLQIIPNFRNLEDMCHWLTKITDKYMDLFGFSDVKHANIIHKTIMYIRRHFNEKITLESAAAMVFLSPAYLSRIFKQETGFTFNNFLNNIRIEQSKALLKNNELKIVDIASRVGFDSQSYFTKVFKKHLGMSPLQYRDKYNR
jgi:two-component system, response regulator YesN